MNSKPRRGKKKPTRFPAAPKGQKLGSKMNPIDLESTENWEWLEAKVCSMCGDYGEILCCETCPASYHYKCLGHTAEDFPEDDFYCNRCNCMPIDEFKEERIRMFFANNNTMNADPEYRLSNEKKRNEIAVMYHYRRLTKEENREQNEDPEYRVDQTDENTKIDPFKNSIFDKNFIKALGMANPINFVLPPEYFEMPKPKVESSSAVLEKAKDVTNDEQLPISAETSNEPTSNEPDVIVQNGSEERKSSPSGEIVEAVPEEAAEAIQEVTSHETNAAGEEMTETTQEVIETSDVTSTAEQDTTKATHEVIRTSEEKAKDVTNDEQLPISAETSKEPTSNEPDVIAQNASEERKSSPFGESVEAVPEEAAEAIQEVTSHETNAAGEEMTETTQEVIETSDVTSTAGQDTPVATHEVIETSDETSAARQETAGTTQDIILETCAQCELSDDTSKMRKCDYCSRHYHHNCISPAVSFESGSALWKCSNHASPLIDVSSKDEKSSKEKEKLKEPSILGCTEHQQPPSVETNCGGAEHSLSGNDCANKLEKEYFDTEPNLHSIGDDQEPSSSQTIYRPVAHSEQKLVPTNPPMSDDMEGLPLQSSSFNLDEESDANHVLRMLALSENSTSSIWKKPHVSTNPASELFRGYNPPPQADELPIASCLQNVAHLDEELTILPNVQEEPPVIENLEHPQLISPPSSSGSAETTEAHRTWSLPIEPTLPNSIMAEPVVIPQETRVEKRRLPSQYEGGARPSPDEDDDGLPSYVKRSRIIHTPQATSEEATVEMDMQLAPPNPNILGMQNQIANLVNIFNPIGNLMNALSQLNFSTDGRLPDLKDFMQVHLDQDKIDDLQNRLIWQNAAHDEHQNVPLARETERATLVNNVKKTPVVIPTPVRRGRPKMLATNTRKPPKKAVPYNREGPSNAGHLKAYLHYRGRFVERILMERNITKIGTAPFSHIQLQQPVGGCMDLLTEHCDIIRDLSTGKFYLSTHGNAIVVLDGIAIQKQSRNSSPSDYASHCRCRREAEQRIAYQNMNGTFNNSGKAMLTNGAKIQIGCVTFTFSIVQY